MNKGMCLVAIMIPSLYGCLSYDAWGKSRDTLIGRKFYPETSLSGPDRVYFVRGANSKREIDAFSVEGDDVRYYITYVDPFCKYSILVSPDGVIKSWRRESPDRKSCYIF